MKNYLTADGKVCDFLRGVLVPVDIRDETGQLLGHFMPHVPTELLAKYEKVKQSLDLEEIRRIAEEQKGQGRPLSEVWRRIHAMEKQA